MSVISRGVIVFLAVAVLLGYCMEGCNWIPGEDIGEHSGSVSPPPEPVVVTGGSAERGMEVMANALSVLAEESFPELLMTSDEVGKMINLAHQEGRVPNVEGGLDTEDLEMGKMQKCIALSYRVSDYEEACLRLRRYWPCAVKNNIDMSETIAKLIEDSARINTVICGCISYLGDRAHSHLCQDDS